MDVYELTCPACNRSNPYDGLQAGVYNYSNETLFTENVCKAYYTDVVKQTHTTKFGFHNAMKDTYDRSDSSFVGLTTFNKAMVAYLSVVKTNYKEGHTCSICRCLPARKQTLCIDGLWMGMPRNKMRSPVKYPYTNVVRPNIDMNKFRIVPEQKTRGLLKAYIKNGLQQDQMKALTDQLSTSSLLQFFQYVRSFEAPNTLRCSPAFREFLRALASNSNGLALVFREARQINFNANRATMCKLESWMTHCTPDNKLSMEDKNEIRLHFSALSALLGSCSLEYIPVELHAVLVSVLLACPRAPRLYLTCACACAASNPAAVARPREHHATHMGADDRGHHLRALRAQLPV